MTKLGKGFALLAAGFAVAVSTGAWGRGSHPTLGPVQNVQANADCLDITSNQLHVDWDSLAGATKYSIEVTVGYSDTVFVAPVKTNPVLLPCTPDATLDFSYSSNGSATHIDINLDDFEADPFNHGFDQYPCSLSVRVKGLNPPARGGAQNNPFSSPAVINPLLLCA
jgi:hypothetical protein